MRALSLLLARFEWVHTGLGIFGNTLFFIGSVCFLYGALKTEGTWLFIVGSGLMLVGSLGSGIVKIWQVENRHRHGESRARRRPA